MKCGPNSLLLSGKKAEFSTNFEHTRGVLNSSNKGFVDFQGIRQVYLAPQFQRHMFYNSLAQLQNLDLLVLDLRNGYVPWFLLSLKCSCKEIMFITSRRLKVDHPPRWFIESLSRGLQTKTVSVHYSGLCDWKWVPSVLKGVLCFAVGSTRLLSHLETRLSKILPSDIVHKIFDFLRSRNRI